MAAILIKNFFTIGLSALFLISFLGVGCSLSSPPIEKQKISITVPSLLSKNIQQTRISENSQTAQNTYPLWVGGAGETSFLSSSFLSSTENSGSLEGSNSATSATELQFFPTALNQFSCIGINVMGEGIPLADQKMNCGSGDYLGTYKGLLPITGGTFEMEVEGGKNRIFQLFAVKSLSGCPEISELMQESNGKKVGHPFELARTVSDVTSGENLIQLKIEYNPNKAKSAFCTGDNEMRLSQQNTDGSVSVAFGETLYLPLKGGIPPFQFEVVSGGAGGLMLDSSKGQYQAPLWGHDGAIDEILVTDSLKTVFKFKLVLGWPKFDEARWDLAAWGE